MNMHSLVNAYATLLLTPRSLPHYLNHSSQSMGQMADNRAIIIINAQSIVQMVNQVG